MVGSPNRKADRVEKKIKGVLIPADPLDDLEVKEFTSSNLSFYQEQVGGLVEVVELTQPEIASLYINEEGLNHGLAHNVRATLFVNVHCPRLRGETLITGPAFLVGGVDDDGDEETIPNFFLKRLTVEHTFRVMGQDEPDGSWGFYGERFHDIWEAYQYAVDLVTYSRANDVQVSGYGH